MIHYICFMSFRKQVADKIKEARLRQNVTAQSLADAMGVDRANLTRWENANANITVDNIERIAGSLGLEAHLEFREPKPKPKPKK